MTPDDHKAAAHALIEAERSRTQIGLLSVAHPDISMDDAYAIQDQFVATKVAAGDPVIGSVGSERTDLLWCGENPDRVKIQAPQKRGVVQELRHLDPFCHPFRPCRTSSDPLLEFIDVAIAQ